MGAKGGVRGAGVPHQPVGAHEGDEFSKRSHNAQQSPQHGAAGDNDMAHGCRRLEAPSVRVSRLLRWRVGLGGFGSFSGRDASLSEHFRGTRKVRVDDSQLLPTFPSLLLLISCLCDFATAVVPPPSTRAPFALQTSCSVWFWFLHCTESVSPDPASWRHIRHT